MLQLICDLMEVVPHYFPQNRRPNLLQQTSLKFQTAHKMFTEDERRKFSKTSFDMLSDFWSILNLESVAEVHFEVWSVPLNPEWKDSILVQPSLQAL